MNANEWFQCISVRNWMDLEGLTVILYRAKLQLKNTIHLEKRPPSSKNSSIFDQQVNRGEKKIQTM